MTAIPKPAKGEASAARRRRRSLIETRERAAKSAAKMRDRFTCRHCGDSTLSGADIEAAHLRTKGHGGDGGRWSSEPSDFVALCDECHRGRRSVHSGHLRMNAGPRGGDGHVRFEVVEKPGQNKIRGGS